ncbi:hypothetical protein DPMN_156773 [Dreissena polymorpha]|uniref:G-protein coupled receptors family 1 profile domain-containing protein n=1 Tax=Dreissena polymorpha TaxID=45954 RepID=A0A9D4JC49_DREPO|nr:hypothetical protein DPMN_156773 [Dreissena polymorpha]
MAYEDANNFSGIIPWTSLTAIPTERLLDLNDRYARALLPLTITFGFFMVFGFFGNLLIIVIFIKSPEYKGNNFKVFVLTLAVIDLITSITLIPAEMVKHRYFFMFNNPLYCKFKCFLNVFGASSSCLALLVISVDRYRKVVQPFKMQMSPAIAVKILMGVAVMFPICLAIPGTLMCGINSTTIVNIYGSNTTVYLCESEKRFKTSVLRNVYKWIFIILHCGISFIYLVLYGRVMIVVVKQTHAIAKQQRRTIISSNCPVDTCYLETSVRRNTMEINDTVMRCNQLKETENVKEIEGKDSQVLSSTIPLTVSATHFGTERQVTNFIKPTRISKSSSFKRLSRHSSRFRKEFPTKTFIWFTLTVFFIVTYLTHIVLALTVGNVVKMTTEEFVSFSFFFRMYFANHIVNPMIYALFVKGFRDSSKQLLKKMLKNVFQCCIN